MVNAGSIPAHLLRRLIMEPEFACASQIDLPDGRRIWVPPKGRPYWVGGPNAGPDLSDSEMATYFKTEGK